MSEYYYNKEDVIEKFLQILDDEGIVLERNFIEKKLSPLETIKVTFCKKCGRWEENRLWYIPYHSDYEKSYCPLMNKEMGAYDFCSRCADLE